MVIVKETHYRCRTCGGTSSMRPNNLYVCVACLCAGDDQIVPIIHFIIQR